MTLELSLRARVGPLELDVVLPPSTGPLVIAGPNGAGKTSLLQAILGLLPSTGRLVIGAEVLLDSASGVDVPLEQRRLGWVPQHTGLFPHLSVAGNFGFAIDSAPTSAERGARRDRLTGLLSELGLGALSQRRVSELSGGERQRVALARALCTNPRALLLDEPLAALDVGSRQSVREFLARWLSSLAIPSVVVTHDAHDARVLGGTVAVLEGGRVSQLGSFEALALTPATAFVRSFTAATP